MSGFYKTFKRITGSSKHGKRSLYDFGLVSRRSLNTLTAFAFLFIFAGAGLYLHYVSFAASDVVESGISGGGYCMDDHASNTTNNNIVDLYTCNGTAAQVWSFNSDRSISIFGKCLDAHGGTTTNGTKVDIYNCDAGATNEEWTTNSSNQIIGVQSGKCLDDPSSTTTIGTQLQIYTCNGTAAQVWALSVYPPATPIPTPVPTPVPTDNPTPVPTANPTPVPTVNPTPVPTDNPTTQPTPVPTDDPTPTPAQSGGSGSGSSGSSGSGGGIFSTAPADPSAGVYTVTGASTPTTQTAAPSTAPAAPADFTASVTGQNAVVTLSWGAPTDPTAVSSYSLDRSIDQTNWTNAASSIVQTSYSDTTTAFGVHYYYRLSAKNAAGTSGYAYADIATPSFTSNASAAGSSSYQSTDQLATVTVPSGAISQDDDCSVAANTATVHPTGTLRIVAGPYQLVCKDQNGNVLTGFSQPVSWSILLKTKMTGLTNPLAYTATQDGTTSQLKGASYATKSETMTFSTTTTDSVLVMAGTIAAFPWALVATIILLLGIIVAVAVLILRSQRKLNYRDYLTSKYYNL